MKPDEATLTTCNGIAPVLTILPVAGRTYEWYFSPEEHSESTLIASGPDNEFSAESSGYYYAVVQSGKCEAQTPRKQVTVHEADKISFPNVVTPNGDPYNERLVIEGNTTIIRFRIVNRYGKLIFSGSRPENWNVDEVTPGVYFAAVTYQTCEGTVSQMKGLVQVMK